MTIEVKRLYLPFEQEVECPKCASVLVDNFETKYLSSPKLNESETRYMVCDKCDTEFYYDIILSLNITPVPNSTKIEYEIN